MVYMTTKQTPWQERGMEVTFHLQGCPKRFPYRGGHCTCSAEASGLNRPTVRPRPSLVDPVR